MKEYLSKIDFVQANGLILLFLCLCLLPFIVKNIIGKNKPAYLKLIPFYILLIIIQALLAEFETFIIAGPGGKKDPTNVSFLVFIVLEFCIFAILLSKFIKALYIKKFLIFSCPIYIVISIIVWIVNSSLSKIFSITTTIESIVLIPLCLFYFYELFLQPPFLSLVKEPSFWITTGILFLLICISPFYFNYKYFLKYPDMQVIDILSYDILVLLFAKACFIESKLKNPKNNLIPNR